MDKPILKRERAKFGDFDAFVRMLGNSQLVVRSRVTRRGHREFVGNSQLVVRSRVTRRGRRESVSRRYFSMGTPQG